jgi:hypothetical protein
MIGTHETFLDVGSGEPVLNVMAADHIINPGAIIAGSCIDFGFPTSIHSPATFMKCSANVPQDRSLSTFVSFSMDLATNQELIEHSSCWCRNPFNRVEAIFSHALLRSSCVHLFPGYIEIASPDNSLSHLDKVPYPGIEDLQKARAVVGSSFIALSRTVCTDKYKCRELQNNTSSLAIQRCRVIV